MRQKVKEITRIDYGIILTVFILFVISVLTLYATTVLINEGSLQSTVMHIVWYILGSVVIAIIMQFDAKQIWKLVPFIYVGAIILLVAVLFFYDKTTAATFGARSWFRFGTFSFQPAEISKIALILMLARVVTNHNVTYRERTLRTDGQLLLKIFLWTLPMSVLVILENDLGTTLVILAIVSGIILMSGISSKILLPLFLGVFLFGALILYLAVYHRHILMFFGFKPYQFTRIDAWLDPFSHAAQGSYQVRNAILAIATGGVLGKGIGISQVHIPIRESDMIFSTIGENTGFLGAVFLIFIYFTLIYQMVRTCFETKNEFYTYISVGVISMIMFHVFENIGMNIGLLPLTGIPLPFISQGGSALLGNMIGVGLIMSMRYHTKSYYGIHII
ncbi:rod shape-determining protein RodA [Granulicatella sp. zg-ZJ]|uniref:FtsW/RodA/SpoVE family cell cycle protein n=1 Tax=unclassified Granulicatella TaxID=2630493 RepID=UPI0013BFD635|nr:MULTISPECIES: FtsW/RodA/SpoVE family cell cycle protein [unclassified Granulicatella]MBS4749865.1 rod shape-determining protein RodA [Carnobacteriaceae bacterium zg-ZUI78]NEW63051.1 rod shape-determining protein RodA [Granulicatella sp. zg-ZJ]NEW66944.1 rod shape-determining protein RodA [Granulicatella sp. zg-84]QMI85960.1 rod shape-determining protein RodA [Carnobacteriaceae bacterium zg-84]